MPTLTTSLAQLNLTVGDMAGNEAKLLAAYRHAAGMGSDIVITSELAVTGYPPEDLVLRPAFHEAAVEVVQRLAKATKEHSTALLLGTIWPEKGKLYNAALLLAEGEIQGIAYKTILPNYGVFDESRLFAAAPEIRPLEYKGVRFGVMICEDMWQIPPAKALAKKGARFLVVLNGSPYEKNKPTLRVQIARRVVRETRLPLLYCNQICGQDELVFDGASFALDEMGEVVQQLPAFAEATELLTWHKRGRHWEAEGGSIAELPEIHDSIYSALVLGLKDYVEKNGFPGVVIGMSGGVDSALTAAIAYDALGKERVHLVMMPSIYTSKASIRDAKACAKLLGVKIEEIPITPMMQAFKKALTKSFKGKKADTTEENLQSRIRGNILMALSNKLGHMVLTTGNKSEMAVGYATLYGDMCGGFNVLKDIYKTDVYALCAWRNKQSRVIPEAILTKAPTAELRKDQKDQDSLPPYEVLDAILYRMVEQRQSGAIVVNAGFDEAVVKQVAHLLKLAEYKRRQAPPGVKITPMAFGRDRRYPITHGWGG